MHSKTIWIRNEATDSQISEILTQRDELVKKESGCHKLVVVSGTTSEGRFGEDGLLHTLNEDGSWEKWMPLKQARQRLESLLFALVVITISSFLFGMFAQSRLSL